MSDRYLSKFEGVSCTVKPIVNFFLYKPKIKTFKVNLKPLEPLYSEHLSIVDVF